MLESWDSHFLLVAILNMFPCCDLIHMEFTIIHVSRHSFVVFPENSVLDLREVVSTEN